MWFKNLQIFKLTETFALSPEALSEKLAAKAFIPCRSVDPTSTGFVSPHPTSGQLVHAVNGLLLICLKREDKLVPASVVKDFLDEKIADIEKNQGRKVRKREKETLKEDILHQLVMRAFSKLTRTYAYLDTIDGYLVVDAANHGKAEDLTVQLRDALGSFQIEALKSTEVSRLLTHWLMNNDYPPEFTIRDRCVLNDLKEKGSIRCQRQNLLGEDIQTLVHEGRMVSELSLSWAEQIAFSLKDDYSVKSLKFLELIQDQARDVLAETPEARFDADFTLMAETLRLFLRDLLSALGKIDVKPNGLSQDDSAGLT